MEHITLKELAEELSMDRSNLRKYVVAEGISTFAVRNLASRGQKMLALVPEDADRVRAGLAWREGYTIQQRRGIRQARSDRELRGILGHVSQGRISGAAAKAKLALILLDGIKVDKDIRKIIESM
jgi:hypothetical protein